MAKGLGVKEKGENGEVREERDYLSLPTQKMTQRVWEKKKRANVKRRTPQRKEVGEKTKKTRERLGKGTVQKSDIKRKMHSFTGSPRCPRKKRV